MREELSPHTAKHWRLDDIDWDKLDPQRVDADVLAAVKTAALVEANSADYVIYLHNVFADDSEFKAAADVWGDEEAQHGAALGRWAEMVDPSFSFDAALARFRAGYQLPLELNESVRGSRAGELLARCVVESGTCSYYSALRDAVEEPVLKQICHHISQDEARHYRLFKTHYERFPALRVWQRIKIALGRVFETGDDELGYAWFSANSSADTPESNYDRRECAGRYQHIATGFYRHRHVRTVVHMIATAMGANPGRAWVRRLGDIGWWFMRRQAQS